MCRARDGDSIQSMWALLLALVHAAILVLDHGFRILGMKPLERM